MKTSRAASLVAGLALLASAGPVSAGSAFPPTTRTFATRTWAWPLRPVPAVVRGFDPPAHPWEAGHRGVDLLGSAAEPVLAMGAGMVRFAGPLAGRSVLVIDHGDMRSTYEPVTAAVHRGDHVGAGQVIGLLQTPYSHCPPEVCLHIGLRRGSAYLDPLDFLGPRAVRLKPVTSSGVGSSGSRAEPARVEPTAGIPVDARDRRTAPATPAAGDIRGARPARRAAADLAVAILSVLGALVGSRQARG